jgi:hypothetical protein
MGLEAEQRLLTPFLLLEEEQTMGVTEELINAVKLAPKRAYKIAHEAGLHPSTLSRIVCGIERVKADDPRVLRLAEVLGIPPERCFDEGREKNS